MTNDGFDLRRKALEEAFFRKENERLLENLRAKQKREDYKTATGIRDDRLVDALMAHKIGPDTITIVELVPLIFVAWSDSVVQKKETKTIMEAAHDYGINQGSPGYELLQFWIDNEPTEAMLDMWKLYVNEMASKFDAQVMASFSDKMIKFTEKVAKAAGLFPGGEKVAPSELKMIANLKEILAAAQS